MSTELSGLLVLNEYSLNGSTGWKTIVCEDTSTITGSSAVNEKKTKCGTFSSVSNDSVKVSGSGVAGGDLTSAQASYQDLQILRDAQTVVYLRRQNSSSGTIAAGEITYFMGRGRFTNVAETAATEENVTFTWEWTSSGTVDFNANS